MLKHHIVVELGVTDFYLACRNIIFTSLYVFNTQKKPKKCTGLCRFD